MSTISASQTLSFAIVVVLLCFTVLLALLFAPLYMKQRLLDHAFADLKRRYQAAIAPTLFEAGFRRPAFWSLYRRHFEYIAPRSQHWIGIAFPAELKSDGSWLVFLSMTIRVPHHLRFLLYTPPLASTAARSLHDDAILSRPQNRLDILRPLGLELVCAPQYVSELTRRAQDAAFRQTVESLLQSGESFIVEGYNDVVMDFQIALQQPTPERARVWLQAAERMARALSDNPQSKI
ncbi:MAG: hypothetical protein RMK84_04485 [Oscillochloridaceae bacterium]|nr:hypothetical protein [Chloroflexaceae bacterium]MDW8389361.1 hypothetical protein [Oscillochloridaceae bacterium]